MNQTFQNSAQVFSIGIFITLMIAGLASTLRGRRWIEGEAGVKIGSAAARVR
jgi:hypothetical protein